MLASDLHKHALENHTLRASNVSILEAKDLTRNTRNTQ